MYPEEKAVNNYDGPMTTEKPASMRDELRGIHAELMSGEKRDAELSERLQQLLNRVERVERTIGE